MKKYYCNAATLNRRALMIGGERKISYIDFDEAFEDSGDMMRKLLNINDVEKAFMRKKLKGNWNIHKIDELGRKGYFILGHFNPDKSLGPLDPLEPLNPWRRPPIPDRLKISDGVLGEFNEPLLNLFEEEGECLHYHLN